MPRLIIDEREIEVPEGTKVIDAAQRLGIVIPRFCYHEALGSVGACRMCAVKFLQGPFKGVQMSCMVDARDGMVVSTTDEEAVQFRQRVIELLMMNHPLDCPVCDEGGQCLLQDETVSGGHARRRFPGPKRTYRDQYLGPYIKHEMNRCIHCYRCSRFYQEFCGYRDLGPLQIGSRMYFGRFSDGPLESPFSGNLVDICPTGVYTDKTARFKLRRWDLQRAPSVCNQCSLGCATVANGHYRGVMRIEARFNRDVNGYFLCDAGRFGFSYANGGQGRRERPLLPRIAGVSASAPSALASAREALENISQKYGPRAIAAAGSNRSSLESQAMLALICKTRDWRGPVFFFDPSERGKTVAAVQELSSDIAVSMREIEKADLVIVAGADPLNEAPMCALAIRQAARKNAPIVTIDSRPLFLPCEFTHFPVAPEKIEHYLAMLVWKAVEKVAENPGKDAEMFCRQLGALSLESAPPEAMAAFSELLLASKRPVIICGTDVTRESTPSFAAGCARLLKCAQKEAGLFFLLPGAGSFGSALLSGTQSQTFGDLVEDIEKGVVRALVVSECDPFHYYPDHARLERAVSKLEQLIAIDYFPSETVERASIFYPASTVFETGSTYINQEGRLRFAQPVHCGGAPISPGEHPPRVYSGLVPGGDHLPAWKALCQIASMPREDGVPAPEKFIPSVLPAFSGLGAGPIYPVDGPRLLSPGPGFTSQWSQRGEEAGEGAPDFELLLVEWMFGTSEFAAWSDSLDAAVCEPHMSINTKDAARAGLSDGDRVSVELDGGAFEIAVSVSERTAEKVLVVPRHQLLDWQKIKGFPVRILAGKIRKI
ncbi:MAG: NADH-quinone oxidoreductase subunit NuoG [Syntrophobacteraceae bacterium]|nr:NADH-quinone oxidoreductase subunit NuoG [Syntrophobacteraceae bacterium]